MRDFFPTENFLIGIILQKEGAKGKWQLSEWLRHAGIAACHLKSHPGRCAGLRRKGWNRFLVALSVGPQSGRLTERRQSGMDHEIILDKDVII